MKRYSNTIRVSNSQFIHNALATIATRTRLLITALAFVLFTTGNSQSQELTKEEITTVINTLADSVNRYYVDEKIAQNIQEQLKIKLARGDYDKMQDPKDLSAQLTSQLITLSDDKHFGVDVVASSANNPQRRMPGTYNHLAPYNYHFDKMEILPGNIGLLEINQFVPTDYTGPLIVAAMNFFSNSDALIIDLRKCIGGDPRTVAQLSGFFFKEPVLLHISRNRAANARDEFWTTKTSFEGLEKGRIAFTNATTKDIKVNYEKLSSIPIYVLTSNATFSAGEGMAFGLQTRQRAKTVGATTGHGGNGIRPFVLPHGFRVFIPFAEIISPITGKGYQLTGVLPDIISTPAKALDVAYETALQHLLAKASDDVGKKRLEWGIWIHNLRKQKSTTPDLKLYAGNFGAREVTYLDGDLYYQREGGTQSQLEQLDHSHFLLDNQTVLQFSDDYKSVTIHQLSGAVNSYTRKS